MRLFKGDVIGYLENRKYKYYTIRGISVADQNLKLLAINKAEGIFKKGLSILFNSNNKNFLNAKQFNISVTGIVTKKKTADINFWKNRK